MIENQETEKTNGISPLDVLVADINRAIHNHSAVYKAEITTSDYPKIRQELTIAWLAVLHDKQGRILCKFMEYVKPIEIQLPLRVWTVL